MTPRMLSFVRHKLHGLSNHAAVLAAGYSSASAKQRGTYLMAHPDVRAALKREGFNFFDSRAFVSRSFRKSAKRWEALSASMPKRVYEDPEEFLLDAINCKELPIEVRAQFAVVLLPYQYKKL